MMHDIHTVKNGFSLVEMLVAVSILLIIIVGPMTVTSRAAKSSAFASEQVQAFFLVQEGLELAQMARDELLLQGFINPMLDPWATFTDSSNVGPYRRCFTGAGCGLEWADNINNPPDTILVRSCPNDCKLFYKASAKRAKYTYESIQGNPESTPFTRTIKFTLLPGGEGVSVTSEVTWRSGSLIATQKVEAQTYLYDIY